jgi:ADP-heptose:LPS heptosyltransferase
MASPSHLIISQIKNIGDVVLCIPTAGLIKQHFPNCKITLLAHHYTHAIAKHAKHFDALIDWTQLEKQPDDKIISSFKAEKADAIIHLSIDKRIARLAKSAHIPRRIGTSQRLFHWFYCNKRVNQARRHSTLHELQLNAQMLLPLHINAFSDKLKLLDYMALESPRLPLPDDIERQLEADCFKLIIHPGSNGHGREWPEDHIIELTNRLKDKNVSLFFTGTQAEEKRFARLIDKAPHVFNTMGKISLTQLLSFIGRCDGLIASGTGPVHIAAALGKQTIGLFPPRKGISPRRWSPPGKKVSVLMHKRRKACFSCTDSQGCECMAKIRVSAVEKLVLGWLSGQ